jgi:ribosomal protein L20A (L18A)
MPQDKFNENEFYSFYKEKAKEISKSELDSNQVEHLFKIFALDVKMIANRNLFHDMNKATGIIFEMCWALQKAYSNYRSNNKIKFWEVFRGIKLPDINLFPLK